MKHEGEGVFWGIRRRGESTAWPSDQQQFSFEPSKMMQMLHEDPTAYFFTHGGYVMRITFVTLSVEADDAIFKFTVDRQTAAGSDPVSESLLDVFGRFTVEQMQEVMHRVRERIKARVCSDGAVPATLDSSFWL